MDFTGQVPEIKGSPAGYLSKPAHAFLGCSSALLDSMCAACMLLCPHAVLPAWRSACIPPCMQTAARVLTMSSVMVSSASLFSSSMGSYTCINRSPRRDRSSKMVRSKGSGCRT